MRKMFAIILAAVLAISLCACGGISSDAETTTEGKVFDLDEYKREASEFRRSVYDASIILGNVGVYENKYWEISGSLNDEIVNRAFDWLAKNSDESKKTVDANNESIRAAYKKLVLIDIKDNAEATEINSGIRSLYDAYCELYRTVLAPSGSRGNFATSISDLINKIQSANDNLRLFLPENPQ